MAQAKCPDCKQWVLLSWPIKLLSWHLCCRCYDCCHAVDLAPSQLPNPCCHLLLSQKSWVHGVPRPHFGQTCVALQVRSGRATVVSARQPQVPLRHKGASCVWQAGEVGSIHLVMLQGILETHL